MVGAKLDYRDGLRFGCCGCGQCCRARGGYAYVYVSLAERRRLAGALGLTTAAFTRAYCEKTDGWFHLKMAGEECVLSDGRHCRQYAARPDQCRSWPFWPENMYTGKWHGEIAATCRGIGRGRRHTRAEIERTLAAERRRATRV